MNRRILSSGILFFVLISPVVWAGEKEIREPFVAGAFYPADKNELDAALNGFFEKAPSPEKSDKRLLAMVVPHAGYFFSGQTAAVAYKLLKEHPVRTVVLLGPYHKAMFQGASVWRSGSWRTPLGEVPVDGELAEKIAKESAAFQFTEYAHETEHSLETQVPFLQKSLKDFKIVPILVNDASPENIHALAQAIHKNLQGQDAIVIASSDMSHYYTDEKARAMDMRTIEFLKKQDAPGLYEALKNGQSELCGHAAVLTALEFARLSGNTTLQFLNYSNSADSTGDQSRVVGYGASAIWIDAGWTVAQKTELLSIARQAVEARVKGEPLNPLSAQDASFNEKRAVFVTLKMAGQLRGCIGTLLPELPLAQAVQTMAVQAATADPRFLPVTLDELKDIHYDISVLSLPSRVQSADEIVMGKHGVIVSQAGHSGVFLPQVAEELGWDKETFMNELCSQKAHLPENCWKDPATQIEVFTAEEFS